MNISPIRTEADYDAALAEVSRSFDNEPERGTPEGDRLEIILALIRDYEDKHWRIEAPDPLTAINAAMEDRGHTRDELAAILGSSSRVSEILNRKRRLTVDMIHRLSREWHIPADVLVAPYEVTPPPSLTQRPSIKKRPAARSRSSRRKTQAA